MKQEQQIFQDYETLKKMAREDVFKELIKELEKIKEWPEPLPIDLISGSYAPKLADMYLQYDIDCEKHRKQIEELIKKIN